MIFGYLLALLLPFVQAELSVPGSPLPADHHHLTCAATLAGEVLENEAEDVLKGLLEDDEARDLVDEPLWADPKLKPEAIAASQLIIHDLKARILAQKKTGLRSGNSHTDWAFEIILETPLKETDSILTFLARMIESNPETSRKAREELKQVFLWNLLNIAPDDRLLMQLMLAELYVLHKDTYDALKRTVLGLPSETTTVTPEEKPRSIVPAPDPNATPTDPQKQRATPTTRPSLGDVIGAAVEWRGAGLVGYAILVLAVMMAAASA